MNSDTPRTDDAEGDLRQGVHSEFARQLERELNAAKHDLENVRRESRQYRDLWIQERDKSIEHMSVTPPPKNP